MAIPAYKVCCVITIYCIRISPIQRLLRDRSQASLRGYWPYVDGNNDDPLAARRYSELMADSQHLIANHILDAVRLSKYDSMLDVGGGTGTFARLAAERFRGLKTAVFDLPQVVASARGNTSEENLKFFGGNMFEDPIPQNHDLISLVRILHDHDDEPVAQLLRRCFDALPSGGTLMIAEPMAGTRGAMPIGDSYFSFYLWAMGSGRPRTKKSFQHAQSGWIRLYQGKTHPHTRFSPRNHCKKTKCHFLLTVKCVLLKLQ